MLGAASLAAGAVEATVLALVAVIASSLSAGPGDAAVDIGPFTVDASLELLLLSALGLALLRGALQALTAYLPARMSADAMAGLRRRLFDAFSDASWSVQAAERDGQLQSLMIGHVGQVSVAVITLGQLLTALFMLCSLLGAAVLLSPATAAALVVVSGLLLAGLRPLSHRIRANAAELSNEGTAFTTGLQEVVRLAEETQVFGASDGYRTQFYDLVESVRRPLWRTRFLSRLGPVLYQTVALVTLLLALGVVARFSTAGLASLAAVVLLLVRSLAYGNILQETIGKLAEIAPFLDRLRAAVDHYEANRRRNGDAPLPEVRTLAMRGVRFGYDRAAPVLRDVSFEVHAGEVIGIVGPSGAGKSTLVQLLLRLREAQAGSFTVNGTHAGDIGLEAWQQQVAYVPQAPLLRWATVAENIRFHRRGISDDEVERAARLAGVHDEITGWPAGYDTVVGERGAAVSGGQRQRLCLARALVTRPSVLVLDEPTSALDVRSEALIQRSIRSLGDELIVFMVAHRLSTLAVCDRVMVIDGGRLEAFDTPERIGVHNRFFREAMAITRKQTSA
ncbi:MAG: ABC transporter ATP-binding protein [Vicinamibacterales bacterium]